MRETILLLIITLFPLISPYATGATFKGKVIDADTKEPIEGAVVVVCWHEETATISGPSARLKDVKETLTDRNGEWEIEGPKGRRGGIWSALYAFLTGSYYTLPPEFIIFKPGYCPWPIGFSIDSCKGKIKPEGNDKVARGETVEISSIRNANREERLRAQGIGPIYDGWEILEKQKEFIRLLNLERKSLGLSELSGIEQHK